MAHTQSHAQREAGQQQSFPATYSYRLLTGVVFLLALAFTMLVPHDPQRLHMPEPWSYALAAEKFAQGRWTLTDNEAAAARTQVRLQGSRLTQYVEIEPGRWAFRQSPGHSLQLALFWIVGSPRLRQHRSGRAGGSGLVSCPGCLVQRTAGLSRRHLAVVDAHHPPGPALHQHGHVRGRRLAPHCRRLAVGLRTVGISLVTAPDRSG